MTKPTDRAKPIRLLVLDVDGVLTDGGLYFDANGLSIKKFNVLDGVGMRIAMNAGIEMFVISGMDVPCVRKRMEILGITRYHGGSLAKLPLIDATRQELGLEWSEVAYLGDDWIDLTPMGQVGFAISVPNAHEEVQNIAHMILKKSGGQGAVRELVDFILKAQGKYNTILQEWKNLTA